MKRLNNFLCGCIFTVGVSTGAANLPADWQHEQDFDLSTNGLVKISLPVETLNVARPALEDLRLYDDAGNEIPYVIERPKPLPKRVQAPKSFNVSLNESNTVITLDTGLSQPVDAVSIDSATMVFIKAVQVESSDDGNNWRTIAQGRPIFRNEFGVSNLKISFPQTTSKWLRLTVDDRHSQPIPFTRARVFAATTETAPVEKIPTIISERDENPHETRLALNLGAANLDVASVQIETAEPLFMREISFAEPQVSEDSILEQTIGQGTIYRVAVEGQTPAENLSMPFENIIRSRELILFIKNGDSPPLSVKSVSIERRPAYLVFLSRQTGKFHLLTGNPHCDAPRYDLAGLNMDLESVAIALVKIPAPADNPDYHAPEVLSGIEIAGAPLDTTAWKYRKPIKMSHDGAQQIELDLDVLAHANSGFTDVRIMRGSNQVPYIVERTSINHSITPTVAATNDTKNPKLSRWLIQLPQNNLPLTRLACVSQIPLFGRSLTIYEEVTDNRGEKFRRELGQANWTQTPERKSKEFSLALNGTPETDKLFLETENGDNPAIQLEQFQFFYPATRLLFKAKADDDIYLYYGNPNIAPPRYDLSLVANQLLAADKKIALPGDEQQLRKSSWRENEIPGKGGVVFWGILALVVIVLLVVISRLLPKSQTK